jgi:hypothetical protein
MASVPSFWERGGQAVLGWRRPEGESKPEAEPRDQAAA